MADTNAVGGLKWVKDEIVTSLRRVRGWLEAFAERGIEDSHLNDAVAALGEVRGVLSALQLIGPARLTEEMQASCEDLLAESLTNPDDAAEALMLALIQLSDYLDKLEDGLADVPLALLPSINDLRGSRGAAPLSEAELLVPASVLAESEMPRPALQKSLALIARKVRSHFHLYLLQWFHEDRSREGLVGLGRLFHRLQRHIAEGIFHELFLVAEAVIEALLEGSISGNLRTKALIAHLDRVIKPFATDARAWPQADAQELLFDLLSLIAHCKSSSYRVNELRTVYGLESEAGDDGQTQHSITAGPGPEALGLLVAETRRELAPIKDALDLFARGDQSNRAGLRDLEPQLHNLANTLATAGADNLVERLRHCANAIGAMAQENASIDDEKLVSIAQGLLGVEAELGDLGIGGPTEAGGEAARALVVRTLSEARVDMAKVEQTIRDLVGMPADHGTLRNVPDLFRRVSGALHILVENDAAEVLDTVVEQVEKRFLSAERTPEPFELDLLAQAISGIDLYMAGLSEGEPYRADLIVEARRAIGKLSNIPIHSLDRGVDDAKPQSEESGLEAVEEQPPTAPMRRIDPELLDIFLEEAREEEETIAAQFSRWRKDEEDEIALTSLRRSFHTLKGSSRLVGALRVGEFSRAVEMLLNRVIDHTLVASAGVMAFMDDAVGMLLDLIAAEAQERPMDVADLVARAESLSFGSPRDTAEPSAQPAKFGFANVIPWPTSAPTPLAPPPSAADPVAPEDEASVPTTSPEPEARADDGAAAEIAVLAAADEELLDIFRTEAREHLEILRSFLDRCSAGGGGAAVPDESVVRALHTLTGSARMTGVESTAKVTAPLEHIFLGLQEQGAEAARPLLDLLERGIDALQRRLVHLPGYGDEMAELRGLAMDLQRRLSHLDSGALDEVTAGRKGTGEIESDDELLVTEAPAIIEPEEDVPAVDAPEEIPPEEDIFAAETSEEILPEEEILPAATPEEVLPEEEILAAAAPEQIEPEENILTAEAPDQAAQIGQHPRGEFPDETIPFHGLAAPESPPERIFSATAVADPQALPISAGDALDLSQDQELISLFLEDARDIVDRLDRSLRKLQLAPTESEPLEEMQRSLHTLKGSARLSGLAPIGDLSHAFESLLTAISRGEARADDDNLELAQRTLDTLSDQIDAVEHRADVRRADDLVQALALALALEEGLLSTPAPVPDVAVMAPSPPTAADTALEAPPAFIGQARPAASAAGAVAETGAPRIRVRSDLLNRLVNNAGEISIYRARLARQGVLMGFRLGELDRTVDRLREQLRNLAMETEAQILHRLERDADSPGQGQGGFDPLELDRFSTQQQFSRSLAETVNDLVSLRALLRDLQGASDTLLQQQSRIAEDLQDGLLRTRMVPFLQAIPRLRRVVRQTAQQMGKDARLEVFGPEVELDRSIQERILAPLEHLLRNAVAHGIELPKQRAQEGKSTTGVVSLVLNREGNDVVITVADDGVGLDLEAIRRRALERGLIAESADVGEEELPRLILESGFTTLDQVSQIAGRGVGLDVVNAEVKQLSGTLALETQPGRGTSFTIRLPLTLAIIEALLVQLGDEIFAVPNATVEAVSRISRSDLDACYRGQGGDFTYVERNYRVMYLRSMLQLSVVPDPGERRWLPVLLAHSGDQRIAFHVDRLLGTQRIVVKPLGPELSSIRWLSGGTILPDGRVALILDLPALIRSVAVQDYRPSFQAPAPDEKRRPCILVVDDSLTVRRVTSRMLQRQNMDVITAADGVDALTRLEERVPDLVLLDIDMPRMDGYELARHIRRSECLKHIPLVMITSRTGEKHRRHALDLGVDRYLGKPYQEADLLDEISSLLVDASL